MNILKLPISSRIHCQMVSVFGNGVEIRSSNKTFVKREKLQNTFKLKWKSTGSGMECNETEKSAKRYKTSLKSSNNEERRPSKVEFKIQPNLVC